MKSRVTEDFLALFARLPSEVQAQARTSYRTWQRNPSHPGLHFKRVRSVEPLYSIRIGRRWRALGLLEEDTIYWFWIGSHAEYDNQLG